MLAVLSALIIVVASLMTAPPPEEKIKGLTYASIHQEGTAEIKSSWDLGNKIMAAAILVCVAGMYLYFSFWLM